MKNKLWVYGVIFLVLIADCAPVFNAKMIQQNNGKEFATECGKTEYYALIIGISEYKNRRYNIPKPPFPPIASWKLKSFYNSIMKSSNWKPENVILLINENATKENIINALQELSTKVDSNDIFVFSYQGHGSEVPDEAPFDEKDGTDEIIVPYDFAKENGKPVNYITDDELNYYFSQIHAKGMALIFESCLSGGLVGGGFDVDKENRVVITSTLEDTIGRASFLFGFPMTFGLAIACDQDSIFHAPDVSGDGFISIEESFNWAVPIIYGELSLYWIGGWIFLLIKQGNPFMASIHLFIEFVLNQIISYIISGHFLLNYPHMIDNYPGELPLVEAKDFVKNSSR